MSGLRLKARRNLIISIVVIAVLYILGCCLIAPLCSDKIIQNKKVILSKNTNERVRIVDDNEEAFLWRLRLINEAKDEIIFTTFELRDDNSGKSVMAALLNAAQRGVSIKIVIDGILGQMRINDSDFFQALTAHPNITVKYYNPLHITKLWKVNYRLHEKYLIVDDTAYILGGRNTHDTYLGEYKENVHIDRDILVYEEKENEDSSLHSLREYFEKLWNLPENEQQNSDCNTERLNSIIEEAESVWNELLNKYGIKITTVDWDKETVSTNGVTFLSGESEATNKKPILWNQLCYLMKQANEKVIIQTPVMICNNQMKESISDIYSKVGDIEIITNTTENWINPLAAVHPLQKKKLVSVGTGVYEYAGNTPMHTKTILIDDRYSIIGSFNMDNRSAYLDTEVMVVIDSQNVNQSLQKQMDSIKKHSIFSDRNGEKYGELYSDIPMSLKQKVSAIMLELLLNPFSYVL